MLVAKIKVCGSMEMGLDACGSVLAAEIGACGSTKSVLVGLQRSVLMGFDSCGACGGDWCLWWRVDLIVRERRRRRRRRRRRSYL